MSKSAKQSAQTKEKNVQLPQLGLVCITLSDAVRYRTITRKRLLQFDVEEQKRVLRELYADNLARLNKAIDFCYERNISLYRMTSALFPFADDEAGEDVLDELSEIVRRTGERAIVSGIRLVLHPDQFVVLSSDAPQVVANSIKILATHAKVMDYLAQPRTSWAAINIHGGKGSRSERLIEVINSLPDAIRLRLTLENDEYTYSAQQILDVCRAARVPMIFDAHHHICREKLQSYEDSSVALMLDAARSTWPVPEWQIVHISNGESHFGDRRHSELISIMPSVFRHAPWIEVEAKHKELAIGKLMTDWLPTLRK
jgi:UV DNA damage endonuclease